MILLFSQTNEGCNNSPHNRRESKRSREVGLFINAKKTEFISLNQDRSNGIEDLNGNSIKSVDDFKYLGSLIVSTSGDIEIRLGKAWGG